MTGHHASLRIRGYTLVEVLAVVMLMGLVLAALVPNLLGASDRARMDRLIAELIDFDVRARLLATQDGGCLIEHEPGKNTVVLRDPSSDRSKTLVIAAPPPVGIEFQGETQRVVFDWLGESSSYAYRITTPSTRTLLAFNGRSGWYELQRGDGHE